MITIKSISCRSIFLLFVFLFLLSNSSLPQQEDKPLESEKNAPFLHIGFLNEIALYYHHPLGDRWSIKTGLSAHWDLSEDKDGEAEYTSITSHSLNSPVDKREVNSSSNYHDFTLSSLLFYRVNDYKYASIYLGFGPAFSYSYSKSSYSQNKFTDTTYSKSSNESRSTFTKVGPSISLMITSNIYKGIFLVSEYNVSVYYGWNKQSFFDTAESKPVYSTTPYFFNSEGNLKSNSWTIKLSNVKIGLMFQL